MSTLGAAFTKPLRHNKANQFTFGLNGFLGRSTFEPVTDDSIPYTQSDSVFLADFTTHRTLYDVNPYAEYFFPWSEPRAPRAHTSVRTYPTPTITRPCRLVPGLRACRCCANWVSAGHLATCQLV